MKKLAIFLGVLWLSIMLLSGCQKKYYYYTIGPSNQPIKMERIQYSRPASNQPGDYEPCVLYIDWRAGDHQYQSYSDKDADGLLEELTEGHVEFRGEWKMINEQTYLISDNAEQMTTENNITVIPPGHAKALEIQAKYEKVRQDWLMIPSEECGFQGGDGTYPENLTVLRPARLKEFQKWLAEYQQQWQYAFDAKERLTREDHFFGAYDAFLRMREAYYTLNYMELEVVYNRGLDKQYGLISRDIDNLIAIDLSGPSGQSRFESFLELAYMETDYMSSWHMYENDETLAVHDQNYKKNLIKRKLIKSLDG